MARSAFHFPDKNDGPVKAPVDQESRGVVDHADAVKNVSAEGAPKRFMQPRNRAGNGRLLPNRQTPVPAGTKPFDGERHNARLHRSEAEDRQRRHEAESGGRDWLANRDATTCHVPYDRLPVTIDGRLDAPSTWHLNNGRGYQSPPAAHDPELSHGGWPYVRDFENQEYRNG